MKTFREIVEDHSQSGIARLLNMSPATVNGVFNKKTPLSGAILARLVGLFGEEFDIVGSIREHRADDYELGLRVRRKQAQAALRFLPPDQRAALLAGDEEGDVEPAADAA